MARSQQVNRLSNVVCFEVNWLWQLHVRKPRMIEHLLARTPMMPILFQAHSNETLCLLAQVTHLLIRQIQFVVLNDFLHFVELFAVVWHFACKKNINHH